jgi:hypothetical protein
MEKLSKYSPYKQLPSSGMAYLEFIRQITFIKSVIL